MKKLAFLLAMLMLLSSFALAEAPRTPGADKLIDDPVMGVTTTFKKYDAKFYDKESAQPGTIVRLDYTTDVYGETLNQWANVYLPYCCSLGQFVHVEQTGWHFRQGATGLRLLYPV